MRNPRRRRKDFPYYKIQIYDEMVKVWKDERKAFDTLEAARDHIEKEIAPRTARIVVVERDSRQVLEA